MVYFKIHNTFRTELCSVLPFFRSFLLMVRNALGRLRLHGFISVFHNLEGTENQNRIPKSWKGRLPQPLKEWMGTPRILSLEHHIICEILFSRGAKGRKGSARERQNESGRRTSPAIATQTQFLFTCLATTAKTFLALPMRICTEQFTSSQ